MAMTDLLAIGPTEAFRVDSTGDIVDADAGAYFTGAGLKAQMQEVGRFVPVEITDPGDAGAIPVTQSGVCHIVTAGAETRTVADPAAVGMRLTLYMLTDGGNGVVTFASAVNQAGNNTATFANAGEALDLVSARDGASAYHWHVVGSNFGAGGGLSTV